jgi:hypothetical protein
MVMETSYPFISFFFCAFVVFIKCELFFWCFHQFFLESWFYFMKVPEFVAYISCEVWLLWVGIVVHILFVCFAWRWNYCFLLLLCRVVLLCLFFTCLYVFVLFVGDVVSMWCFVLSLFLQVNSIASSLFYFILFFMVMETIFISIIVFCWNNNCHHRDFFFCFFHDNGSIASFYFLCFFWQLHYLRWTWVSLSASNFSFNIFIIVSRRFSFISCCLFFTLFVLF